MGHEERSETKLQELVQNVADFCRDAVVIRCELVLAKINASAGHRKVRWCRQMLLLVRGQRECTDRTECIPGGKHVLFLILADFTDTPGSRYKISVAFSPSECKLTPLPAPPAMQPGFVLVGRPLSNDTSCGRSSDALLDSREAGIDRNNIMVHVQPLEDAEDEIEQKTTNPTSWLDEIGAALRTIANADLVQPSKESERLAGRTLHRRAVIPLHVGVLLPAANAKRPAPASGGTHSAVAVSSLLAVSPGGIPPQLWLGMADGRIQVYDAGSCMLVGEFQGHDTAVEGMVLMYDDAEADSGSENTLEAGVHGASLQRGAGEQAHRATVWSLSLLPHPAMQEVPQHLDVAARSPAVPLANPPRGKAAASPSAHDATPDSPMPAPSSSSALSCVLNAWALAPVRPLPHRSVQWRQEARRSGGSSSGGGGGGGAGRGGGGRSSVEGEHSAGRTHVKVLVSGHGGVLWVGLRESLSAWEVGLRRCGPKLRGREGHLGGPTTVQGVYHSGGLRMESMGAVSESECWVGSRHAIRVWVCDGRGGLECVRQLSLGARQLRVLPARVPLPGEGAKKGEGAEGKACGAKARGAGARVVAITYDERVAVVSASTAELLFRVAAVWEDEEADEGAEEGAQGAALAVEDEEVFVVSASGDVGVLDLEKQRVEVRQPSEPSAPRREVGGELGAKGHGKQPRLAETVVVCGLGGAGGSGLHKGLFALARGRDVVSVYRCRAAEAVDAEDCSRESGGEGHGMRGERERDRRFAMSPACHRSGHWATNQDAGGRDAEDSQSRVLPQTVDSRDDFCLQAEVQGRCLPGMGRSGSIEAGTSVGGSQEGSEGKREGQKAQWHFDGEVEEEEEGEGEGEGEGGGGGGAAAGEAEGAAAQKGGQVHDIFHLARVGREGRERVEWRVLERGRWEGRAWGDGWEGPVTVLSSWLSSRAAVLQGGEGRCWVLEKSEVEGEGDGTEWMQDAGWGVKGRGEDRGQKEEEVEGETTADGPEGMEGAVCAGVSVAGLVVAGKGRVGVVGYQHMERMREENESVVQREDGQESGEEEDDEERERWGLTKVTEKGVEELAVAGQGGPGGNGVFGGWQVTVIACGLQHCCMVLEDGGLYAWGNPAGGVLGLGEGGGLGMDLVVSPTRVRGFGGRGVQDVACGHTHTVCAADGKAYVWGSGLVTGAVSALCGGGGVVWAPGVVEGSGWGGERCGGGALVVGVGSGANFVCILTAIGEVVTFGRNRHGALGHGHTEDDAVPRRVEALWRRRMRVRQARCGRYFLAVITDGNEVYMWGTTNYPGLSGNLPIQVTPPSTAPPVSIACTSDLLLVTCGGQDRGGGGGGAAGEASSVRCERAVLWKGQCEVALAGVVAAHRTLLNAALSLLALATCAEAASASASAGRGGPAFPLQPPEKAGAEGRWEAMVGARLPYIVEAMAWAVEDLQRGLQWMQGVIAKPQCRWDARAMAAWVWKAKRAAADAVEGGREVVEAMALVRRTAVEEREGEEGEFVVLGSEERRAGGGGKGASGARVGWAMQMVRALREEKLMGGEGEHVGEWPMVKSVRELAEGARRHGQLLRVLAEAARDEGEEEGGRRQLAEAVAAWREVEVLSEWAVGRCHMEHVAALAEDGGGVGSSEPRELLRWVDSSGVGSAGRKEGSWRIAAECLLGGKGRREAAQPSSKVGAPSQPTSAQGKAAAVCVKCDTIVHDAVTSERIGGGKAMCRACLTKELLVQSGFDQVVGRRGVGSLGGADEGVGMVLTTHNLTILHGSGGKGGGWMQTIPLEAVWVAASVQERDSDARRRTWPARTPSNGSPGAGPGALLVCIWSPECRLQLAAPSERVGREWVAAVLRQTHARLHKLNGAGEGLEEMPEVLLPEVRGASGADGLESEERGVRVEGEGSLRARWMSYEYEDGRTYTGAWKDGVQDGFGVVTEESDGERTKVEFAGWFSDGVLHGRGRRSGADGEYLGEYRGGEREGHGVMKYADGGEYRGAWRGGKRHGVSGRWRGQGGERYEGGWGEDEFSGHGVLLQLGGAQYDGPWAKGQREGWGGREVEGSRCYYGGWSENRKDGLGMELFDGMAFVGWWKGGVEEGPGMLILPNGDRLQGEWRSGEGTGGAAAEGRRGNLEVQRGVYVHREGDESRIWPFLVAEREEGARLSGLGYAGIAPNVFGGGGWGGVPEREWKARLVALLSVGERQAQGAAGGEVAQDAHTKAGREALHTGGQRQVSDSNQEKAGDGGEVAAALRAMLRSEDAELSRMVVRFERVIQILVEMVAARLEETERGEGVGGARGGGSAHQRRHSRGGGDGESAAVGSAAAWWRGEWVMQEVHSFTAFVHGEVRSLCGSSAGWGERDAEEAGARVTEAVLEGVCPALARLAIGWSGREDAELAGVLQRVGAITLGQPAPKTEDAAGEKLLCPRCAARVPHGRSTVLSRCQRCHAHVMAVSSPAYVVPSPAHGPAGGAAAMQDLVAGTGSPARAHPYAAAVALIRQLPGLPTPSQKLQCVAGMFAAITAALAAALHKAASEIYIEPDDLIPITCLVLVEAKVPRLAAHVKLCYEMIEEADRMGERACALANLQGCIAVLLRAASDLDTWS